MSSEETFDCCSAVPPARLREHCRTAANRLPEDGTESTSSSTTSPPTSNDSPKQACCSAAGSSRALADPRSSSTTHPATRSNSFNRPPNDPPGDREPTLHERLRCGGWCCGSTRTAERRAGAGTRLRGARRRLEAPRGPGEGEGPFRCCGRATTRSAWPPV